MFCMAPKVIRREDVNEKNARKVWQKLYIYGKFYTYGILLKIAGTLYHRAASPGCDHSICSSGKRILEVNQ